MCALFTWALAGLLALAAAPVQAARTINSATVNGVTSVTVVGGATISANVVVTTDGSGANARWRSTGWRIDTAPPGSVTCVDHTNHDAAGTFNETFNITAPGTAGTYNVYFIAYNNDSCSSGASTTFTLTNGVIVDNTPPTVTSINLTGTSPTNAASVQWTVTFSESVTGVDNADFSLVNGGLGGTPAITGVSGSGTTWTVTASTGTGSGTLGLNLVDNDTIVDTAGNRLGGTGAGNGDLTGQVYTIDRTVPTVSSINRVGASPTNTTSPVQWTVTFSESVTGVDSADFSLINTGLGGTPAISSVTGSGTTWTVTANPGTGSGTLGLNLVDDDSIADSAGNKLGGTGTGNGNFTGQVYTIDRTAPTVSSIVRVGATPTNASSIQWTVTFSESVTGVDSADFSLANTGLGGTPAITGVSGSGTTWTVTASTGTGNGTLGLNLVDNDSIIDSVTNPLGGTGADNGNFTGQVYTLDRTAPAVSSIVRVGSNPTNTASVQWTVTFSKSVTGVDSTDFSLAVTGLGGTPAITGVSGSSTTWTVTASTGTGDGTLGLNLVDDDTIIDSAGNPLGGTGTGNGNFTGEVYNIIRTVTSPTSFNAVEPGANAASGKIFTKIAGQNFALDIVALDATNAILTSFTGAVAIEVVDNSGGGVCSSLPSIVSFTDQTFVTGDNGRHALTSPNAVANVWPNAKIRIKYPSGSPTTVTCSGDNFAIRPASITITAHDANWQTAGTTRALANTGASGGVVHKASTSGASTPRPFTLRATPSPASATNYAGSPTIVGGFPACGTLCTTVGTLTFTGGSWTSAGSGVRENATANYSEAGTFNLQLEDATFAAVDAADGTPAAMLTIPAVATVEIGRFVPDRFEFAGANTPAFLTFGSASACGRSFTYVGQTFWFGTLPTATINAVNAGGGVTTNYALSTAALKPVISETYTDATAPAAAPLNVSSVGLPAAASGAGTGSYSAAMGGQLSYTRNTSSTSAVGPFTSAISLSVSASDGTEAAVTGNGTITTASPLVFNGGGTGIAFDLGAQIRYGRLRLTNANGSPLVPLAVRMETQYYSGAPANTFITNVADNCTSVPSTSIAMSSFTANLTDTPSCDTAVSGGGTFSGGRKTVLLAKPGAAHNGSVTLTANLGSAALGHTCATVGVARGADTGSNLPHLKGNWTGGTFTENPTAKATFGAFPGSGEVLDVREFRPFP